MNQKKGSGKLIAALVILAVLIVGFVLIYRHFKPQSTEGAKAYTVEVVDSAGETKTYTGRTDAEFLRGLMDELVSGGDFSYEGEDSDYGIMIMTINGETADFATDGAYWAIYVNGEYGQYGADEQPVEDGGVYAFRYEKG